MSEANTSHPANLVSLSRGAALTGLAVSTLRRRVAQGLLPAWKNPRDTRAVLIRVSDLERLRDQPLEPLNAAAGSPS